MKKRQITFTFGEGNGAFTVALNKRAKKKIFAGTVSSPMLPKEVDLVVDDDHLLKVGVRLCYITLIGEEKEPFIFISSMLYEALKQDKKLAFIVIFHELGHYVGGHLDDMHLLSEQSQKRADYVREGKVEPHELFADNFAAKYIGAENTARGLVNLMIQRQMLDSVYGELDSEESIATEKEYKLRIKAIINSNEELLEKCKSA